MKVLRKYLNRRLYDPQQSRYITLSDVRDFVQAGEEVVIRQKDTNADVTLDVLWDVLRAKEAHKPTYTALQLQKLIRA